MSFNTNQERLSGSVSYFEIVKKTYLRGEKAAKNSAVDSAHLHLPAVKTISVCLQKAPCRHRQSILIIVAPKYQKILTKT